MPSLSCRSMHTHGAVQEGRRCCPRLRFGLVCVSCYWRLGLKPRSRIFRKFPGRSSPIRRLRRRSISVRPVSPVLKDGSYLTKCDEFGPATTEHESAVTNVFRSEDQGKTWKRVARLDGLFWANIFTYGDAVYLMGTTHHHGRIVVRRSDDGGSTWTSPTDGDHGLITAEGEYHTAPHADGRTRRQVVASLRGRHGRHTMGRAVPSSHAQHSAR